MWKILLLFFLGSLRVSVGLTAQTCCDCLFGFTSNNQIYVVENFSGFLLDPSSPAFQWQKIGAVPPLTPNEQTLRLCLGAYKTVSGSWLTVHQGSTFDLIFYFLNPDLTVNQFFSTGLITQQQLALRTTGVIDECSVVRAFFQKSVSDSPWAGFILNSNFKWYENTQLWDLTENDDVPIYLDATMTAGSYDFKNRVHYGVESGSNVVQINYTDIQRGIAHLFHLGDFPPVSDQLNYVSTFFDDSSNPKLWGIASSPNNTLFVMPPIDPSQTKKFNISQKITLPPTPPLTFFVSFEFGCARKSASPCTDPIIPQPINTVVVPPDNTVAIALGVVFSAVGIVVIIVGALLGRRFYRKAQEKRETQAAVLTEIEIGKQLGSGQYGQVFKGKWQKSTDVALKKLTEGDLEAFNTELKILIKANHPNVVRLFGVYTFENTQYLVYEFISGGSVDKFFSRDEKLRTSDLLGMVMDLVAGVKFLHLSGIIHRDLAARNLLVREEHGKWSIKIADFGLSQSGNAGKAIDMLPLRWSAPEVIAGGKATTKSDIWSVGICMWEILSRGRYPYLDIKSNKKVLEFIEEGNRLEKPSECPDLVYQLMMNCWREEPARRPDAEFLREHLQKIVGKTGTQHHLGGSDSGVDLPVVAATTQYSEVDNVAYNVTSTE